MEELDLELQRVLELSSTIPHCEFGECCSGMFMFVHVYVYMRLCVQCAVYNVQYIMHLCIVYDSVCRFMSIPLVTNCAILWFVCVLCIGMGVVFVFFFFWW